MKLSINNIYKTINHTLIINNLSLIVNSGKIAILLGRSGAGKSTLLRILNNLEEYSSGEILLNDISINKYKEKQIGMVFQSFNLFSNLSVLENIILSLIQVKKIQKNIAIKIACQLLEKYNLLQKKNNSVYSLSGGEKQKIAIIRTLAMDTKIICFDEPISALDPYSTHDILTFIKELQHENYIIIMTTHNVSILNQLDCSINLLHNGTIVESIDSNFFFSVNNINKNNQINKFIHGVL